MGTNALAKRGDYWNTIDRYFLGFDNMFKDFDNLITKSNNYPPYNVIHGVDGYAIEMTVAGFGKDDIEVKEEELGGQRLLKVTANAKNVDDEHDQYVHRGLAKRNFQVAFRLGKDVEVTEVTLNNGILLVELKENKPEPVVKTYEIK